MPDGWQNPKKNLHDSFSEWVKSITAILKSRIKYVRFKMRIIYPSAFNKQEVIKQLNRLHEEFVLVPADKACNNIVFVCKAHYHQCIFNELGINSGTGNCAYTPNYVFQR
jgi:hypothetical protein